MTHLTRSERTGINLPLAEHPCNAKALTVTFKPSRHVKHVKLDGPSKPSLSSFRNIQKYNGY